MSEFNSVDIIIVIALVLHVLVHYKEGVLDLTRRLLGLVGAVVVGFLVYREVSQFLQPYIPVGTGIADALAFVLSFIFIQGVIKFILRKAFSLFPYEFKSSRVSKVLAVVPAFVDGLILVSLVLFILMVAPFLTSAKSPIQNSYLGSMLVRKASSMETYVDQVFGRATQEGFSFMTIEPEEGESVSLPFKATALSVDREAEIEMLELINAERAKVGALPLVMEETLTTAARAHSTDMWQRHYFAHENPDGLDPFDRMRRDGAVFRAAGENLALARTTLRGHEGLMNSPGHKRNILDPVFKRVGIGVIDGGVYGMMFTQDFSD